MAMQAQDPEAGRAWADRMNAVREGCEGGGVSTRPGWRADPVTLSHEAVDLPLESTLRRALGTSAPSLRLDPSKVYRGAATYSAWDLG